MTTWKNAFAGQTPGAAVTTGNSATSGDGFTFVSTAGTCQYATSALASPTRINVTYTAASGLTQYTERNVFGDVNFSDSFYYDVPASNPSATTQMYSTRTAVGQAWGCNHRSDGKVQILDSAGTGQTISSAALVTSTRVRIDIKGFSDATAGTVDIGIYNAAGTLIQSYGNTALNTRGGAITNVRQGKVVGSTYTGTIAMGQISGEDARTTFMGPWVDGYTITIGDTFTFTDTTDEYSIVNDYNITLADTFTLTDVLTHSEGFPVPPDVIYAPYYPTGWDDEPTEDTAIVAAALDRIDAGIIAVAAQANQALTTAVGNQAYADAKALVGVRSTVTSNFTAVVSSHNPVDATSGAITATLPSATGNAGTLLVVEKTDATTNAVIVSGTIRGVSTTLSLVLAHESVEFVSNGAGSWWPIAGHKILSSLDGRYDARYGQLGVANTWTAKNTFNAAGNAMDYSGTLDGGSAAGSYFRASCGFAATTNGINDPARGDLISNSGANGAGASFFYGHYLNLGTFSTKGSFQGVSVYGTMGANASYGEMGAYTATLSNTRTGGLIEGYESSLTNGAATPGRLAGVVSVISEANASNPYYSRGFWASSQGAQLAGDAFYVEGAGGWTNFARFLHTDGTDRFRIDNTGKLYIGAGALTLYASSGNLVADAQIVSGTSFFTAGAVQGAGFYQASAPTHVVTWGTGVPALVADIGSLFLRTDGGTSTTLYVKQSGNGTSAGWVAK